MSDFDAPLMASDREETLAEGIQRLYYCKFCKVELADLECHVCRGKACRDCSKDEYRFWRCESDDCPHYVCAACSTRVGAWATCGEQACVDFARSGNRELALIKAEIEKRERRAAARRR